MLPAVALVGRPNVGKSTLFNQLTRSRDALVADFPGLTRDRRYGFGSHDGHAFLVVDTGGLGEEGDELRALAVRQTEIALEEADAVVFVVDYKDGLTAADERVAAQLRSSNKPVTVAVNKSEGLGPELAEAEFHSLGLGAPVSIAALYGRRLGELMTQVLVPFAPVDDGEFDDSRSGPYVAVVGRPNVGKSTLINRLLGSARLITSAEPGTTRDSVHVTCRRHDKSFVLVDTAGIRRRAKVNEFIEKFSVVQSLRAIENAGVVILLVDAREGIIDQDLHLIGLIVERGRAITIGVNKWDNLESAQRRQVEAQIDRKLEFVAFARITYLSALHGSGIDDVLAAALNAYDAAGLALPTPRLNAILERAMIAHSPPLVAGRRIRLRYAHQGGRHPPIIVIHGNRAERLPGHYQRYLVNFFRRTLKLEGAPLRLEFKSGDNPYAGKRNTLTRRQVKRRQRVIRHSRRH
ncbi:MAG: ribosome biogenesis GTPase Der [Gammaproteobacteria bacterium]|nr:MAG: ribosome biogenesis GTPase Der [Gammaproteobacteria bacterium]